MRCVLIVLLTGFAIGLSADDTIGVRCPALHAASLDGWQAFDCEAIAQDGAIVIRKGQGFLRTDFPYADFVLEFKYRSHQSSPRTSAVLFRAPLPTANGTIEDCYQLSLQAGAEGNVERLAGARSAGLIEPDGWNQMKLTVVGVKASLDINGRAAWQVEGVSVPSGYIALRGDAGSQTEFRDVFITEIGYKPLFNGQDLSGWEGVTSDAGASWKVERGEIVCTGQRGTWLRSTQQYGDFNLRFAYKLRPGGNSGIYVRVPADGAHREGGGTEIQLLDDQAERYKGIEPTQFTGSVYKVAPAAMHVSRPAGEWNTMEINCRGTAYRVRHNGAVIVDASDEQFPELKQRLLKGYLGLQNHSEEVWFRDLRIGPAQP